MNCKPIKVDFSSSSTPSRHLFSYVVASLVGENTVRNIFLYTLPIFSSLLFFFFFCVCPPCLLSHYLQFNNYFLIYLICLGAEAASGFKKRNNWGEAGASLEMPVDSYRLVYLIEHLRARIQWWTINNWRSTIQTRRLPIAERMQNERHASDTKRLQGDKQIQRYRYNSRC